MIERKRAGQFRAVWEDYGQCVNLLASGEVWLADAWNPWSRTSRNRTSSANTPRQRKDLLPGSTESRCRKTLRTSRRRSTTSTSVSRMVGRAGSAARLLLPRPRPATSICKRRGHQPGLHRLRVVVQGGSSPEPKEGWPLTGRDTGAYDTRWGNIMHWMTWPDDPDYYATRWNDFLSA